MFKAKEFENRLNTYDRYNAERLDHLQQEIEAIKEYFGIEVVGIPAKRVAQEIDES